MTEFIEVTEKAFRYLVNTKSPSIPIREPGQKMRLSGDNVVVITLIIFFPSRCVDHDE